MSDAAGSLVSAAWYGAGGRGEPRPRRPGDLFPGARTRRGRTGDARRARELATSRQRPRSGTRRGSTGRLSTSSSSARPGTTPSGATSSSTGRGGSRALPTRAPWSSGTPIRPTCVTSRPPGSRSSRRRGAARVRRSIRRPARSSSSPPSGRGARLRPLRARQPGRGGASRRTTSQRGPHGDDAAIPRRRRVSRRARARLPGWPVQPHDLQARLARSNADRTSKARSPGRSSAPRHPPPLSGRSPRRCSP